MTEKEPPGWTPGSVRLEKNAVIKLGRVRLRIRDIDYSECKTEKKKIQELNSPDKKKILGVKDSPGNAIIMESPAKFEEDGRKTADPKTLGAVLKGINKRSSVVQNDNKTYATDESDITCKHCWGTSKEDQEAGITEEENPFI